MIKENITIEDLARMVKNGFEETAKRNEVNSRFDIVENRLDKIEKLISLIITERIKRAFCYKIRTLASLRTFFLASLEIDKIYLQQVIHNLLLTNFLLSLK